MGMDILQVNSEKTRADAVRRGVDVLSRGGLLVFPTETVYGVAARADDSKAMERLRDVKSRDGQKAFTVHIGTSGDAKQFVTEMPAMAERLMRKVWPGPLTIIIPVSEPRTVPLAARMSGDLIDSLFFEGTVGLRCPDEPTTSAILRESKFPVVAASANRAGKEAPITADGAKQELDGAVDLLIDTGRTQYGRASTIVRVHGQSCEVLREGVYDSRTIRRLAILRILFVCSGNTCRSPMAEGLARQMMADRLNCKPADLVDRGIYISSAGTAGGIGGPAAHAVTVLENRGIDISHHSSTALTPDMIQQADHVFVMTTAHRDAVLEMSPRSKDHVQLLLDGENVHDPIGGSVEEYEACAGVLEEGLKKRLQEVKV